MFSRIFYVKYNGVIDVCLEVVYVFCLVDVGVDGRFNFFSCGFFVFNEFSVTIVFFCRFVFILVFGNKCSLTVEDFKLFDFVK